MTVARLINMFSAWKSPVSVTAVRDQIIWWGYYDRIVFSPFDKPPGKLQGMIIDYDSVESYATKECCVIRFNQNQSSEEQRLVCVKELVHCMDSPDLKISSKEGLFALLEEILHDPNVMAGTPLVFYEDLAIIEALAILCSEEDREELFDGFHNKKTVSLGDVATRFAIPIEYAGYPMNVNWKAFRQRLLSQP